MAKKLTRKAYFDNAKKEYVIFYEKLDGTIKKEKKVKSKKTAAQILQKENKGKHKDSFKIPSQKKSAKIKSRVELQDQTTKTINRLLKKDPKKYTEKDLELLEFYLSSGYRKKELQEKRKATKIKKRKKKIGNMVKLPGDIYCTYCKTSTGFFYFEEKKREIITRILKAFLFYDHESGLYFSKPKYQRVQIIYKSQNKKGFHWTEELDAPKNSDDLENALTLMVSEAGYVEWTNEKVNITIKGLL